MADKYKTVMTEFKKTARFPGFRVGTIPPFMLDKVKQFVILESLEKVTFPLSLPLALLSSPLPHALCLSLSLSLSPPSTSSLSPSLPHSPFILLYLSIYLPLPLPIFPPASSLCMPPWSLSLCNIAGNPLCHCSKSRSRGHDAHSRKRTVSKQTLGDAAGDLNLELANDEVKPTLDDEQVPRKP